MNLVLDNTIAIAWCFEDEQTVPIMELLDQVTEHGAVAPGLWPLEAVNVLTIAERRKRIDLATRDRLGGFLRGLPVHLDVETPARIWDVGRRLAGLHGLTAYDAAYLEVALRRGLPLATLDRDLRIAARAEGVVLLGL